MNTKDEIEFVRVLNLCRAFDCDRKTMERLLDNLADRYGIEVLVWNGQKRVNYKQFRRAVVRECELHF